MNRFRILLFIISGIVLVAVLYSCVYLPNAIHNQQQVNSSLQKKSTAVDSEILPFACRIAAHDYPSIHFKCPAIPPQYLKGSK